MSKYILLLTGLVMLLGRPAAPLAAQTGKAVRPNIVLIYADDLGWGDISLNGATRIKTPHIDRLASQGLNFTDAHATAATCTPSRYALLTGEYAWRKKGTGIAPGDASLLIPAAATTMPGMLQKRGYRTAVIGKWHLGLGPAGGPDWNGDIRPGPLEVGFDYCFIMPATADRVPCVYVENHRISNLDPADPVRVSYKEKIGDEPTGKENPGLLTMKPSHGHDNTIVNGISRIGWMTGGKKARWIDEDLAQVFTQKAISFIEQQKNDPFFLYLATHDIHVPRVPNSRFAGKSGLGPRGDVILQLDWTVGEIMNTLDRLHLADNTLVIFTSDNGPVVDDGYQDEAVARLNGHTPAGPLRGGKYSAFDGGTRVPFIIRWPGHVPSRTVSDAPFSQVDLYASLARLTGRNPHTADAPDSHNMLDVLLGRSRKGSDAIVEQSLNNTLSVIQGGWKYIEPGNGPRMQLTTNTELGNDPRPQLYNLKTDLGEKINVADAHPDMVKKLQALLRQIKGTE